MVGSQPAMGTTMRPASWSSAAAVLVPAPCVATHCKVGRRAPGACQCWLLDRVLTLPCYGLSLLSTQRPQQAGRQRYTVFVCSRCFASPRICARMLSNAAAVLIPAHPTVQARYTATYTHGGRPASHGDQPCGLQAGLTRCPNPLAQTLLLIAYIWRLPGLPSCLVG